ncbi:single-stranded DNA-binding protein [Myceligenerans pegani]|uniref:Single-stranded DNA-binding protein n=1 Tax=Myceligenerans pegani TaxID=2776917 RepID=A0ABR9N122_9MICO|nr:single-stranded DNA-binding protein [Myceligenerans sp. TRM 65318]MBE1877324.1 single-stranded DNA-binding protein [Myceligenerans sp. TRM 65318]MBE3019595.1 single-stranded DNA-binding protein [Myceligenerans sp. TRM 65318]
MSNEVKVTVTGNAGSDPVIRRSGSGNEWTTFSVASTRRIRDTNGEFYDGPTIWFQVKAWGHAAVNISKSVKKGQPVMVAGRLEVDEWGDEARRRTSLVINADSVGPNLMKGRAEFQRVIPADEPPGASGSEQRATAASGWGGLARGVPDSDAWAAMTGRDAAARPDGAGEAVEEAAALADAAAEVMAGPDGAAVPGSGDDDGGEG